MTEFLTENARRTYPLEREWPAGLDGRWAETLVDACVYASSELGDTRLSLLSVGRSASALVFTVGIPDGAAVDVVAPSGHAGFATVHAESAGLKAILTVDGQKVSALVAAGVKGIWNFTSVQLSVPSDVIVQSVDLAQSLAVLSHKIANRQRSENG